LPKTLDTAWYSTSPPASHDISGLLLSIFMCSTFAEDWFCRFW
jgi:hypothetical protein